MFAYRITVQLSAEVLAACMFRAGSLLVFLII